MDFQGTIPPMATPTIGRRGGIDTEALEKYTTFLLNRGVHGLFPCGSTGEFSSFSREERKTVIQTVADVAENSPVLAGCGDTNISTVLTLIDDAAMAGADAAVVVTPYYLESTDKSLCEFYQLLADDTPLPIILYHIPELTGQKLPVQSISRLAEHDKIIGVKDTSRDLKRFWQTIERTPSSFNVFQGATSLAVPSLRMGADGIVPTSANVFPNELASVFDACEMGEYEQATSIMQEVVFPFISTLGDIPALSAVKHLVGEVGPDIGPPVLPLPELTEHERAQMVQKHQEIAVNAPAFQQP